MITIHDKTFEPYISHTEIQTVIQRLAVEMEKDLKDKNPLFVAILNGAFVFAADLMRALNFDADITFVKTQSYVGTTSTGTVQTVLGLTQNIEGRTIVIVEDIVDTGHTLKQLLQIFQEKGAADVKVAALLQKPDALQYSDLETHYIGMEIPNKFVVGYGLDYDGLGRGFAGIYQLKEG
ncbi:MAG: hypoxanthine phosphoribosyltransferase [Chitinophagales bacterium]